MSNLSVKDSRSGSGSGMGFPPTYSLSPPAYSLPPPSGPAPPIPAPLGNGNAQVPQTNWGVPLWSDWQGDEVSSTNYGPIYNPSAPPPTANYIPLSYGAAGGGAGPPTGPPFAYNPQQSSVVSSGKVYSG